MIRTMSDAQLLQQLVGAESADRMIRETGSAYKALTADARQFAHLPGIGRSRLARLTAVAELARRMNERKIAESRIQVTSPEDVAAHFGPLMRDLPQEEFWLVLLNTANIIVRHHVVHVGGLAASIVEPRAVFRQAILDNAAAVICLHNHPSGNPEPSREDVRVTRQLIEAGRLLGIPVHDHIIIAGTAYTSLATRGLM